MGKKADLFTTREIEIEMLSYLKLIDSGVNSVGLKQRSGTIPGPYQPPLPAQGLGGFQLFYPIIAPLHVGATYPALNHSTHHANRPSVDAISNVVPKQPADLYRPRYYAGGGGAPAQQPHPGHPPHRQPGQGPLQGCLSCRKTAWTLRWLTSTLHTWTHPLRPPLWIPALLTT